MSLVSIPLLGYRSDRGAHESVSAESANSLFSRDGVDWPVSGDQTLIDWGKRGTRAVSRNVNIWASFK